MSGRAGRRRPPPVLLLPLLVLAGCGRSAPPEAVLPDPDLTDADPPVVAKVTEARTRLAAAPQSGEAWGRLGIVLNAHGYYEEAAVCYERASALEPGQARWPYLLGDVLMYEDPAAAAAAFTRSLEIEPGSALARCFCGDALLRAGRDEEARDQFEAALALDPQARRARLGLGGVALRGGDVAGARQHLVAAAELNFYDREVHAQLARVYARMGDTERAGRETLYADAYPQLAPVVDPHRTLVDREGVSARDYQDRGLALVAAGKYAEAEPELREALRLRPGSVRNHLNLGGVLARQGRRTRAIALIRRALELAEDDPEVHNNLAAVLAEDGRREDARRHVDRALELDPRHDEAYFNLGTMLERAGDDEAAAAAFARAVEINPVNARAHASLARLLDRGERPEAALTHWRDAADFGRHNPDATVALAIAASRLGRFGEAVDALRRGLRLAPDDVPLNAALVTILATCPDDRYRGGDEAVARGQRLVDLNGRDHVPSLNLLAAAQAETGDYPAAVQTSERALGLARATGGSRLAALIESRLSLYRAGRPYRQGGG